MDEQNSWCLPGMTVLRGKYRVDAVLGHGGFGITYRGTEIRIGLRIAIKEYYPYGFVLRSAEESLDVRAKPDDKSRFIFERGKQKFLDEAKTLAQCEQIASVVGVRDYFEENQTAYIVMEYLDGVTLKRYLEENEPMEPLRVCRMMLPLIRDLGRIHRLGLLHRDISPDNIMLVQGERLRLMDFGAARNFDADAEKTMTIMLKQGYAPFEQYMRHGKQGPWTDVYALGATIYVCISGVEPDAATDRVIQDKLASLSELGVKIAPPVEQVILKSLRVQPADRYQSADAMADALEAAVRCAMLGSHQSSGSTSFGARSDDGHSAPKHAQAAPSAGKTVLEPVPVSPPDAKPAGPQTPVSPGRRRLVDVISGAAAAVVLTGLVLWGTSAFNNRDKTATYENLVNDALQTPMPTSTPALTPAPTPAFTPSPAPTPSPTFTPSPTPMPSPTFTPSPTPTPSPAPTPSPTFTPSPTPTPRTIHPNDMIVLGRYDYDGNHENGAEPIEWRVLAVEDGKALLISRHVLEEVNFHSAKENISWAFSSLRTWLNETLLQTAFDSHERSAILLTTNTNSKSEGVPNKSTGGSMTQDYLFLLSYKEAVQYFKDNQDRIAYTRLPDGTDGDIKPWWLRSISETKKGAAAVERDGRCTATRAVVYGNIYARPAMWVSIDRLP